MSLKSSYKNKDTVSQSDLRAINGKDYLKESRFLRDDNLFAKVCLNKAEKAYVGADKSVLLNYEAAKDEGSSRDDLVLSVLAYVKKATLETLWRLQKIFIL